MARDIKVNLDIAKRVDIACRRGDTFSLEFIVKDSTGVPLDVTTPSIYTFKMEVRTSADDSATPVIGTTSSVDTGFNILGNDEGVVFVTSSAQNMATVQSGIYVYDIQATKVDDSSVQTWFYGIFRVNEDITI
jgi:hypothetical protein